MKRYAAVVGRRQSEIVRLAGWGCCGVGIIAGGRPSGIALELIALYKMKPVKQ